MKTMDLVMQRTVNINDMCDEMELCIAYRDVRLELSALTGLAKTDNHARTLDVLLRRVDLINGQCLRLFRKEIGAIFGVSIPVTWRNNITISRVTHDWYPSCCNIGINYRTEIHIPALLVTCLACRGASAPTHVVDAPWLRRSRTGGGP